MGRCGVVSPLLINYRFPVKSVSFDCCALVNSWLIVECPPHLWFVGHCKIICSQDSITSLWTHSADGRSLANVCNSCPAMNKATLPLPISPTSCEQQKKRCSLPPVSVFPRSRYFYFLHLPHWHCLYLKVNYPQVLESFKIFIFLLGKDKALCTYRLIRHLLAMGLEQSR